MSPKCVYSYIMYRFDKYLKRRGNSQTLLSLSLFLSLCCLCIFCIFNRYYLLHVHVVVVVVVTSVFFLLVSALAIYHFVVVHVKLNNYVLFISSGKLMSTLISMNMGYFCRVQHIRATLYLLYINIFFFRFCHVFDVIILLVYMQQNHNTVRNTCSLSMFICWALHAERDCATYLKFTCIFLARAAGNQ